jgi:hypothetical protein
MVPPDLGAPLEALARRATSCAGGSEPDHLAMQHTNSARRRRAPTTRPRSTALVWRSPERHLWVATGDGEYAGMTQYDRRAGYTATGPTAVPLGRFPSLEEAKAAIERRPEAREGSAD